MKLIQMDDYRWELPKTGQMNVPGRIFATPEMIKEISFEEAVKQVANVACLPGIIEAAFAMPDIHWGYGFPIGGVAAFDWREGVVSPGGVGYDINCGVRLAASSLTEKEVRPHIKNLTDALFREIPTGVGSTGSVKLSLEEEKKVLRQGSFWAVHHGFGEEGDLERTEDRGCMGMADPAEVSREALGRGLKQLGTLGSGNHFMEIGVVDEIFDEERAHVFGLFESQVTLFLHSGSRGLGYQVCDDSLAVMEQHARKEGLWLPDKQLSFAAIQSDAGARYLQAMACAANYAWANRQILLQKGRQVFMDVLGISPKALAMNLVYDVCHNIAKKEFHEVNGKKIQVCIHRKGATRAFPPGHEDLPEVYQKTGQPILIPGDMGSASYVLCGTERAMKESFGSTCHGAGRRLSRHAAIKAAKGRTIHRELEEKGISVRWKGRSTLMEEMPDAYKNVTEVVGVVHGAGISKKVARLRPIAVIKG